MRTVLLYQSERFHFNNLDDSEDGISRFLQRNPETCLVAVDGVRIVGVILVGSDGRRGYDANGTNRYVISCLQIALRRAERHVDADGTPKTFFLYEGGLL